MISNTSTKLVDPSIQKASIRNPVIVFFQSHHRGIDSRVLAISTSATSRKMEIAQRTVRRRIGAAKVLGSEPLNIEKCVRFTSSIPTKYLITQFYLFGLASNPNSIQNSIRMTSCGHITILLARNQRWWDFSDHKIIQSETNGIQNFTSRPKLRRNSDTLFIRQERLELCD